jgi:GAF domain-containing protein
LATSWDVLGGAQFDVGQRYASADTPFASLVTEDEVILIRDAQDPRLLSGTRQQLAQAGAQAVMLAPVMMRGRFEGFISAVAEQPHDFPDSEVRLMRSAAEQLGVVLSNLQLATEMQTTLERVALLNRRLSNEAWSSYLGSREHWLVESGHSAQAVTAGGLHIPIMVRGEVIGSFHVADADADRQWQEDGFDDSADHRQEVALAIENARLIEQTQRTAQREDIACRRSDSPLD